MGRRSWLGVALAAVLALAGCQDAGEPLASPTTSAPVVTPTPTPTPTVPPPPVLPAAAKAPTQAGAEAFYRYFWDLYIWSFRQGDADALLKITTAECGFCMSAVASIREAGSLKLTTVGGDVTVKAAVAAPGRPEKGLLVVSVVDQARAEQRDGQGKVVETSPARLGRRLDAQVRFTDGRWLVDSIERGDT